MYWELKLTIDTIKLSQYRMILLKSIKILAILFRYFDLGPVSTDSFSKIFQSKADIRLYQGCARYFAVASIGQYHLSIY